MHQPYAHLISQLLADFEAQRFPAAERIALSILKVNPRESIALQILGLSFAIQGKADKAIDPFKKASLIEPKNSEILNNLAKAQFSTERYEDAAKTYQKLSELNPNNVLILTDYASCLTKLKQYDKAQLIFDKAINLDPNYFLVWSNLAILCSELKRHEKALEYLEKSLSLNEDFPISWTHYGNVLHSLGRFNESKLAHEMSISIQPDRAEAWLDYSKPLLAMRLHTDAYRSYQRAYQLKPQQPYLIGQLYGEKLAACDWDAETPTEKQLHSLVLDNELAVLPFILLQSGADLALQKRCAMNYVQNRCPPKKGWTNKPINRQNRKVRIAYFSSDFKVHPVGILMQNIIKLHDRNKFEVIGFFLNKSCNDEIEQSLRMSFDQSFNLFSVSDSDAINLVREQNLDIAIDLNGHTADARTNIFASRIAPIQVNYLGYAGTLGADYYDYIVADRVVIPPEHQDFYIEKIAYLPNSFFPVDTSIALEKFEENPSRISEGLPESGFIFCCFNNTFKISPELFSVWMNLLKQVPGSVLWLSKPSDLAIENLKRFASKAGVDADRIIFARFVPDRKTYLNRFRLASLFLDTPNYNAHSTAADALWMGVPVLTIMGQTFAGRVAASQNYALGMECMITHSLEEYSQSALRIAQDPVELNSLKNKIASNRKTSKLFDSKQYISDLESLYTSLLDAHH